MCGCGTSGKGAISRFALAEILAGPGRVDDLFMLTIAVVVSTLAGLGGRAAACRGRSSRSTALRGAARPALWRPFGLEPRRPRCGSVAGRPRPVRAHTARGPVAVPLFWY